VQDNAYSSSVFCMHIISQVSPSKWLVPVHTFLHLTD